MNKYWLIRRLKFVLFAAAALVVIGFVVMSLWNWLMPSLFGWSIISFWQALGLLVLCRILFGGFRGRPGGHIYWLCRMIESWEQMAREEREKFCERIRGTWTP